MLGGGDMLGGGEYLHKQNSFRMRMQKLKKKKRRAEFVWGIPSVWRSERAADHISNSRSAARLLPWKGKNWDGGFLPYLEEKRSDGSPPIHSSS
jgi:hypothetical protein